MAKDQGNTRGSDGRHDRAIVRYGRMAADGRRTGNTEAERVGGRVVRHLNEVANRQHPPTGGKQGKET